MSTPAFLFAGSDAADLVLTMLIVFGAAKIAAEVFEQLGQPGLVGEILAGIVIGPGVRPLVRPDRFLTALAELGVMFPLFQVGLEVKSGEFVKVGKPAALAGVVFPFLAGWSIMRVRGAATIEAVFVGSAMVATSVGITARVLSSIGLLGHQASQTILAAAINDDVLGLLILAISSSLAKGSVNVPNLVLTATAAIAFTVIVIRWGSAAVSRLVPQLGARLRAGEVQFNLAILLLFSLALLAIHAGITAITGAFLAGMTLPETVEHRVHHLSQGISEFLVPFFLAGIGLNLDVRVFSDGATLWLSVIVLLAAVCSKLFGCGLGALGLGRRNAFRVGAGMVPRGEVGMVVAQIGLSLGVVSQQVYGVVVFMAVATTLAAPPLLRIAYKGAAGRS